MTHQERETSSPDETILLGREWGSQFPAQSIVLLEGDLAAGKTTLIKGIVKEIANLPNDQVQSPTFTYLHIYPGKQIVYHFDLYRLQAEEEFFAMGFDEFLFSGGVCCIEWAERIPSILAQSSHRIRCQHRGNEKRRFFLERLYETG